MTAKLVLGIDIGGSGIKGAPVNLTTGEFSEDRLKIPTPKKSTPKNVAAVVAEIAEEFADQIGQGPVGITIPAVVRAGITLSAANIDKSWIGAQARDLFAEALGRDVILVNDADAAGLAEVQFGAAKGNLGKVLMTTLGTGIGSALIYKGVLIPNTELGHIEVNGHDAETKASSGAKERDGLSYKEWAPRLQNYYDMIERLIWPDLIVVGGGVSRKAEKFLPLLKLNAPIIPAELENRAGIIGAAYLASNPDQLRAPMAVTDPQRKP
ncbi:polyphosphate--glucose phosphotransferase [Naumannella halotolerans]|uniref:Polyphosphate glucokinase n=1 Tax=Naumannella halotolerans TaxID=993414 RepID=A0A4R7J2S9_9ACTN|nr:ROK family protein [Naumannella halotolerans]TDT31335.1 polyphosphate glucokinase [Naumannella halotolerans]